MRSWRCFPVLAGLIVLALSASGCLFKSAPEDERTTKRDKTGKGAAIGAASGAAVAYAAGERELDEVLVGAAIGAGIGAGIGAYMDHQEEKLARIPGTTVERVGEGVLLVRFDSDILFDVGSATLNGSSMTTLEETAEVLLEYRKTDIIAQGHTDSSGGETYNQQLSEKRAESVTTVLIGNGVGSERITVLGYGESQPVASNTSPDGRSQNRRVELLLKAKAK